MVLDGGSHVAQVAYPCTYTHSVILALGETQSSPSVFGAVALAGLWGRNS